MVNAKAYVNADVYGVLRVGQTRVSLDSVVYAFRQGHAPETIRQQYSALSLEEIYGAIAFYLANKGEVDQYLQTQEQRWDEFRRQAEQNASSAVARFRGFRYDSTDVRNPTLPHRESAMKHIDLNAQGEAVKQFFLSLPGDPEGSVVVLNGQAVARVTPLKRQPNGSPNATGPWTEAKNARRGALIDREIDGTLTTEEAAELRVLQQQMLRERQRLVPVPLDDLRRLHQKLLMKAQKQADQGRS
jgi:uncharacterized protein (DUF433 family)